MLTRKAESCNFAEFPLLYTAMAASWPVLGPFSLLGSCYSRALHVSHIFAAGPSMCPHIFAAGPSSVSHFRTRAFHVSHSFAAGPSMCLTFSQQGPPCVSHFRSRALQCLTFSQQGLACVSHFRSKALHVSHIFAVEPLTTVLVLFMSVKSSF
jgi:hypothetical protein